MRKVLLFILIVVLLFPYNALAVVDTSSSSIVMDIDSGRILYQKNANEQRLIASITKIMTAVLAIENKNLDDVVTIGEEVLPMYGSNIYIEVGEKMRLRDLLYGLLLRSGNDAAVAIATYVAGSEEKFVKMMNDKAKEIGMTNTIFKNAHGLDEDTQNYSTAHDMALLSRYANTFIEYCEISSTKKWTVKTDKKSYVWYNRNKLLSLYSNATGGKTGYTPKAGRTLVTTASDNNLNLTVVTLNDANEYDTHESLYNYIFSKYSLVNIIDKNNFIIDNIYYSGDYYVKESFSYPLTSEEEKLIKKDIFLYKDKTYNDGDKIGEIVISLNGEEIFKEDILASVSKKEKEGIFSKFLSFFKNIFS